MYHPSHNAIFFLQRENTFFEDFTEQTNTYLNITKHITSQVHGKIMSGQTNWGKNKMLNNISHIYMICKATSLFIH